MTGGVGALLIVGLPLMFVMSCVWATVPLDRGRPRVVVLGSLLATCAGFVVWCMASGVLQAAIVVLPAVVVAAGRLLADE